MCADWYAATSPTTAPVVLDQQGSSRRDDTAPSRNLLKDDPTSGGVGHATANSWRHAHGQTRRTYQDKASETHLLRRTFREVGKVENETFANLSHGRLSPSTRCGACDAASTASRSTTLFGLSARCARETARRCSGRRGVSAGPSSSVRPLSCAASPVASSAPRCSSPLEGRLHELALRRDLRRRSRPCGPAHRRLL